MATETSGGSSFEAGVLDSISALSSSFDAKLAEFKEQLMEEQRIFEFYIFDSIVLSLHICMD